MADYTIPEFVNTRLRYFNTQFLQEQDFIDEQKYHINRERLHNKLLHTPGIAGIGLLVVTAEVGSDSISISPGVAVDGEGRTIVLPSTRVIEDIGAYKNKTVLVLISYPEPEEESRPAAAGGAGNTRWHERPVIELFAIGDDTSDQLRPEDTYIRLASVTLNDEGTVVSSQDVGEIDVGGNRYRVRSADAGVKYGGEVTVRQLEIAREDADPSTWPHLSSGDANRVDVNGDLLVTGSVNDRDIAADGTKLDAHTTNTDNPHRVTAAKIDSEGGTNRIVNQINISSGVINAARVDSAIALDSEVSAKVNSHANKKNNPHQVTATQIDSQGGSNRIVNQINSGSGVINQARIDSAIATDNDVTSKVNSHANKKNNPHQVTAAQIDSQGGSNRIVNQINSSSGVINQTKIDSAIARDSEVISQINSITAEDVGAVAKTGGTIKISNASGQALLVKNHATNVGFTGSGVISVSTLNSDTYFHRRAAVVGVSNHEKAAGVYARNKDVLSLH